MLRRELAKLGRDLDLAPFECFLLCMACGHLAEPRRGDPMRSLPLREARCPACGTVGLADLRHTPTVHSLTELEELEAEPSVRRQRVIQGVSISMIVFGLAAVAYALFGDGGGLVEVMQPSAILIPLGLIPLGLISLGLIPSALTGSARGGLPQRWRLPKLGIQRLDRWRRGRRHEGRAQSRTGELLRAPLSGRPCLAYEIAVRSDDRPDRSFSSWRLIEQDNAEFAVGEVEVPRGGAVLRLPRQLSSSGMIAGEETQTQNYMRMRGFLDSEEVYIYETILAPGDDCRIANGDSQRPTQLFAA